MISKILKAFVKYRGDLWDVTTGIVGRLLIFFAPFVLLVGCYKAGGLRTAFTVFATYIAVYFYGRMRGHADSDEFWEPRFRLRSEILEATDGQNTRLVRMYEEMVKHYQAASDKSFKRETELIGTNMRLLTACIEYEKILEENGIEFEGKGLANCVKPPDKSVCSQCGNPYNKELDLCTFCTPIPSRYDV